MKTILDGLIPQVFDAMGRYKSVVIFYSCVFKGERHELEEFDR